MKLLLGLSVFLLSSTGTIVKAREIDNTSETIVIHWNMESAKNNYIEWDEINSPKSSVTKDQDINLIESNVAQNKDIHLNEDSDNGPIIIHWRANSVENQDIENVSVSQKNPNIENPSDLSSWENPNVENPSNFSSWENPNIKNPSDFSSWENPNVENPSDFSSWENPNVENPSDFSSWENPNVENPYVSRKDPVINWSMDSTIDSSEEIEIFDEQVIIDGKSYSQEEFTEMLQQSELKRIESTEVQNPNSRVMAASLPLGAVAVKFGIWGLRFATNFILEEIAGELIIYAAGKIVDSSSWLYEIMQNWFYEVYY